MTQDSESVVVPRWKLVPVDLDEHPNGLAMLVAGKNSLFSCSEDPELDDARRCWSAMIAAGPSVREELRNEVKRLISEHVSACFTMSAGGVIPTPLHPGPTADTIIAALVPSTDEGKRHG